MSGQSHSVIVHHLTKIEKTECIFIALAILFYYIISVIAPFEFIIKGCTKVLIGRNGFNFFVFDYGFMLWLITGISPKVYNHVFGF